MNTCICFRSRFTCFTLLLVHFLREPQYCFDANRFGEGYIMCKKWPVIFLISEIRSKKNLFLSSLLGTRWVQALFDAKLA